MLFRYIPWLIFLCFYIATLIAVVNHIVSDFWVLPFDVIEPLILTIIGSVLVVPLSERLK
ncbi:MAG: hypothetical protein FWG65_10860 [Turicibacter sp.]|nr:hypothetical protein [Turicibacter sp.]